MIRQDLLEFQYYLNRLSIFMKESYGMQEQFEIFYQQLKQVNDNFDYMFNQLDVFNTEGRELPDEWISELIDKIGLIFNCYRKFTIVLSDGSYEEIELDDYDFITYIKCQIVKQNFKGSREELANIYTTYEDGQITSNGLIKDLIFVYVLYQTFTPTLLLNSIQCNIYWSNYSQFSENLQKLFDGGYLTIESMGILYNRIMQNIDGLGIFAKVLTINNGDYYHLGDKYYIWNSFSGWHESNTAGSGTEISDPTITTPEQLPNYGHWYHFAGQDGDYFKIGSTYKIWNASTKTWSDSASAGSGVYWGELNSIDDLPVTLEGGFFA